MTQIFFAVCYLAHIGVELLVPGGEEGGGDVQPLAVQAELQHLGRALYHLAGDVPGVGLDLRTENILLFP